MIKKLLALIIVSILLYLQVKIWNFPLFGLFLLSLLFYLSNKGGYLLLTRCFTFSSNFYTKILSFFLSFFILSFLIGVLVFFELYSGFFTSFVFLTNGLIFLFLEKQLEDKKKLSNNPVLELFLFKIKIPFYRILLFIYLILCGLGFYFLYISKTQEVTSTPWQTVNSSFIYIFFLASLVLGFLIFSKLKYKTILFLLILFSLLLHFYLPLTHDFFYGADQWRHIGAENRIIEGLSIGPATQEENTSLISNFSIGKLSYVNFWGINALLSQILRLDLVDLNKWFLSILFSLFFPILVFEFGRTLSFGKKESLFLVFASNIPFALQVGGAMSLPVGYGFLFFVLTLIFFLQRFKNKTRNQIWVLLFLGILSLFGYVLYFILFWLIWILLESVNKILGLSFFQDRNFSNNHFKLKLFILCFLLIIFFSFLIPFSEILIGHSFFLKLNFVENTKQLVGNFLGWYLATGPRLHDITTGNILFNQVPIYSFVQNFFTKYLLIIPFLSIIFWLAFIFGTIKAFIQKNNQLIFISTLSLSLFFSYVISRYFLEGENILTRRLDMVLAFLFIVLFTFGLLNLFKNFIKYKRNFSILLVLFISLFITISFSLGPDTQTISKDQYDAMQFVVSKSDKNVCVLADTYSLLILEGISKKEIIGGNFPIKTDFSQAERENLINLVKENNKNLLEEIKNVCKSNTVWVLADEKFDAGQFGQERILRWDKFNNVFIWEYDLRI